MLYKIKELTTKMDTGMYESSRPVVVVDGIKEDLIKKYENDGYDVMHDYGDVLVMYKEYYNENLVSKIYITEYTK